MLVFLEWLLASTFFTAEQTAVSPPPSRAGLSTLPRGLEHWITAIPSTSSFLAEKAAPTVATYGSQLVSSSASSRHGAQWRLLHREDTSLCKKGAGKFIQKERLKECPSMETKRILWHLSAAFSDNLSTEIVLTALSQPLCLRSLRANRENRQNT